MGSNDVHVIPVNDQIQHTHIDCICGPEIKPVSREDGSMGWLHVHHSLDGREKTSGLDNASAAKWLPDLSSGATGRYLRSRLRRLHLWNMYEATDLRWSTLLGYLTHRFRRKT